MRRPRRSVASVAPVGRSRSRTNPHIAPIGRPRRLKIGLRKNPPPPRENAPSGRLWPSVASTAHVAPVGRVNRSHISPSMAAPVGRPRRSSVGGQMGKSPSPIVASHQPSPEACPVADVVWLPQCAFMQQGGSCFLSPCCAWLLPGRAPPGSYACAAALMSCHCCALAFGAPLPSNHRSYFSKMFCTLMQVITFVFLL